jgi:NitT/TauT family transport system substrate-binding protein
VIRIRSIAVALALALVPAFAAGQPAPVTMRIGATPVDDMPPLLYAMRTGMFAKAGIKVELTQMASGATIAAAVAGGALDAGKSSMIALIVGHVRAVPFTMIAPSSMWVGSDTGGLLVGSSSNIRTAKDFSGKIVSAASLQDINVIAMLTWLDQNGGDSKAVKFVEMPTLAAPAALEAGRIDGATLFNPAFTEALAGGHARNIGPIFNAVAKRFLLGAWFTTTGYVEKNRGVIERFSRVMADASTYVMAHPDETLDDIAALTKIDRNVLARMQRTTVGVTLNAADIQPVIDLAAKYKVIEKPFPASELISDAAAK